MKKAAVEKIKKTNIIREFQEIAHDIFLEEDRLLLKLEKSKVTPLVEEINEEEAVHEIRVNFRRLISLLYFYRPLLKKKERKAMAKELNLLLKSFSAQRTYDIFRKSVLKYADFKKNEEGNTEEIEITLQSLIEESVEKSNAKKSEDKKVTPEDPEFKSVYESIYQKFVEGEENLFKGKTLRKIKDPHDFKKKRIRELIKTIGERERKVDISKVKEIHSLRILGKNIFYTINSFDEEFKGAHEDFLGHLQKIQDVAGKIHDAEVNLSILDDLKMGNEKHDVIEDFMSFLEREKAGKIAELKEIIEEKID